MNTKTRLHRSFSQFSPILGIENSSKVNPSNHNHNNRNNNNNTMTEPRPDDVICGRGADARNHPGNRRFRSLINLHCDAYSSASKSEKTRITKTIVDDVVNKGGRFLKKDMATGSWNEIDSRSCREKTGQSLRECAASKTVKKQEGRNPGVPCSRRGTLLKLQQYLFAKMTEVEASEKGSVLSSQIVVTTGNATPSSAPGLKR